MTIPPLYGARLWLALAAIAFLAVAALTVPSCIAKHRAQAAQARVNAAQGQAAVESGKDAINAVSAADGRQSASEAVSRANEQAIRAAPGADQRVDMGVHSAGLAALCKRQAYKDDAKCKGMKP